MSATLTLSGGCRRCSRPGSTVFHPGVTWCPREMASVFVDWNACRIIDGHYCHYMWTDRWCSHPVVPGEGVILTDHESVLAYGVVVGGWIVEVPDAPPNLTSRFFWHDFWQWVGFRLAEGWTPPDLAAASEGSGT